MSKNLPYFCNVDVNKISIRYYSFILCSCIFLLKTLIFGNPPWCCLLMGFLGSCYFYIESSTFIIHKMRQLKRYVGTSHFIVQLNHNLFHWLNLISLWKASLTKLCPASWIYETIENKMNKGESRQSIYLEILWAQLQADMPRDT